MTTQESIEVRNGSGATVSIVETSKVMPWLMLTCILSGFALAAAIYANVQYGQAYRELERENRLVQLKIDEYRMALMNAGIDPNPHLDGESK